MENREPAIQVKHLEKVYRLYDKPTDRLKESLGFSRKKLHREYYALKDVNFEVNRGETVGIIGTNGSGKSTILKIITGVLNPTKGDVIVDGRISALLELGAGFNGEYSGLENVYLNGTMTGFSREEIDKKIDNILEFADIGDFIYQPVKTYSSGMFVRLAFAVAINIDPEILIIDEALSVGDVFFQAKCYHKFEEFKKLGKTILFVSHDLGAVAKYCDRVILLNKGEKLHEGEPKQIVDLYKQILAKDVDDGKREIDEKELNYKESLTNLWKDAMNLNPKLLEYGEKRAEIIDFAILDHEGRISNTIEKGEKFSIKIRVRFHEKINEPIVAFTIKDMRGTEIAGTNTMYEKIEIPEKHSGEECIVTFSQVMNLQGAEYLFSFGCTGYRNGDFHVYHRLYDVCSISVLSSQNTVGYFDMFSEVEVE